MSRPADRLYVSDKDCRKVARRPSAPYILRSNDISTRHLNHPSTRRLSHPSARRLSAPSTRRLSAPSTRRKSSLAHAHAPIQRQFSAPRGTIVSFSIAQKSRDTNRLHEAKHHRLDSRSCANLLFSNACLRVFVAILVCTCSVAIHLVDPIARSNVSADAPIFGTTINFIRMQPMDARTNFARVTLVILAVTLSILLGKLLQLFLSRRLAIFKGEQGSWVLISVFLVVNSQWCAFAFNTYSSSFLSVVEMDELGVSSAVPMIGSMGILWRIYCTVVWMVTSIYALGVFDMVVQDAAKQNVLFQSACLAYIKNNLRIGLTITHIGITMALPVIAWSIPISSNTWTLAVQYVAMDDLQRVLVTGLVIALQLIEIFHDLNISVFYSPTTINNADTDQWILGLRTSELSIPLICCIPKYNTHTYITAKWVQLGLIIYGTAINLRLLVAQIYYIPSDYGQFIGDNSTTLFSENGDELAAQFEKYSIGKKGIAGFIPSLVVFITIGVIFVANGRVIGTRVTPFSNNIRGLDADLLEFIVPSPVDNRRRHSVAGTGVEAQTRTNTRRKSLPPPNTAFDEGFERVARTKSGTRLL